MNRNGKKRKCNFDEIEKLLLDGWNFGIKPGKQVDDVQKYIENRPGPERRYIHKSLDEVAEMQQKIKQLQTQGESELLQAEIDLQQHISAVGDTAKRLRTTLKVNNSV